MISFIRRLFGFLGRSPVPSAPGGATRPRIWTNPTMLAALKQVAKPGNDRYDTLMRVVGPSPADWNVGILNYCLAYLLTNDATQAAKAWDLMSQSMVNGVNQVTTDSGYQCRNYFPAAVMVRDWLDPWLSASQKQLLVADMETCAAWVWPETNPSRVNQWAVDNPLNNYYHGFMLTGMAGLALLGDSPKAQGMIDLAASKWNSMVVPQLTKILAGGYMIEGTSYGSVSIMEILQYTLATFTSGGPDLIGSNPWFTDAVSTMIALTNPRMTELAPFGDLGAGPISDTHRRVMLMLRSHDARCDNWLNSVSPNRCSQQLNAYAECLWGIV